jgi:hypothetical protein
MATLLREPFIIDDVSYRLVYQHRHVFCEATNPEPLMQMMQDWIIDTDCAEFNHSENDFLITNPDGEIIFSVEDGELGCGNCLLNGDCDKLDLYYHNTDDNGYAWYTVKSIRNCYFDFQGKEK